MGFLKQALAVLKISAKSSFVYRFDFIVSMFLMPIQLIVYYMLWKAIFNYSGQEIIRCYTFPLLIGYYVIEMVTSMIIWNRVDTKIEQQVRKGKMSDVILRPMNPIIRYFLGQNGGKIVALSLQTIPFLIIGFIFFGVKASAISLFYIPVALLALAINFLICFIVGTSAFWLKKSRGLISIREIITDFISGGTIPLTFLPLWFQSISWFLPFQYSRFIPINVFLGFYDSKTILLLMLVQIIWIGILYVIAKMLWNAGVKKYTGVGQ